MGQTSLPVEKQFESIRTCTYTTDHYIFHYQPGSLAGQAIKDNASQQEQAFSEICGKLHVKYPERIHYYFTDSPLEIGSMFWGEGASCNGCAIYEDHKIYAVYNEEIKCIGAHEDTHLISYLIGIPISDFITEGLAMYFHERWWGRPNEEWAAYYKSKHPQLSIEKLLDNVCFDQCGCTMTYPIAGAFTKFIIDTYGIERYIAFYRYTGTEYGREIESIYGVPLKDLEDSFWKEIFAVSFDSAQLEDMLSSC